MSWGTYYSNESNNIHFEFPALMTDGRHLTDYNIADVTDKEFKEKYQITNSLLHRKALQENSIKIMNDSFENAKQRSGFISTDTGKTNSTPYLEKHTFYTSPGNTSGYKESDLRNIYLSREQLNETMLTHKIM